MRFKNTKINIKISHKDMVANETNHKQLIKLKNFQWSLCCCWLNRQKNYRCWMRRSFRNSSPTARSNLPCRWNTWRFQTGRWKSACWRRRWGLPSRRHLRQARPALPSTRVFRTACLWPGRSPPTELRPCGLSKFDFKLWKIDL